MRFVLVPILAACAACSFPRPQDIVQDGGDHPGGPGDAGAAPDTDSPIDASIIPRCTNLGFHESPWPETGTNPFGIAPADLNGDGNPDLVTANDFDNTVSVLLGNGDGTFQRKVDYPTNAQPRGVAVADVNGDAKLDLVVTSLVVGKVSVLLGNGDGTFGIKTDYTIRAGTDSVTVADINGDGKPDIMAGTSPRDEDILINNGNGTFGTAIDIPLNFSPRMVVVTDINSDGKADMIIASAEDSGNSVSVLLGKGGGSFLPPSDHRLAGSFSVFSVAVADVNGDGKLDAVATNYDGNVTVLLGDGAGSFSSQVDFATTVGPLMVRIADLNGDAKPDPRRGRGDTARNDRQRQRHLRARH